MARSKETGRASKTKKGNKVVGVNKAKTKAVKTNLKLMKVNNKAKTEEADVKFNAFRHEMIEDARHSKTKIRHEELSQPMPQVNLEETMLEFKKLGSDKT